MTTDDRHHPMHQMGAAMCVCGLPAGDPAAHLPEVLPPTTDPQPAWDVIPPVGESAPVGRALMLTQQEWDDLAEMVDHFRLVTNWIVNPHHHTDPPTHIEKVKRQRALAERIIEANQ